MNGNGRRSGVPKTERRPPGADDVELVGDGDSHGGGTVTVVRRKNEHASEKKTPKKTNGTKRKNKKNKKMKNKKKKKKKRKGGDATPAAHEVHETNEYSKQQQFFDEEHVNRDGKNGHKDRQPRGGPKRKRPPNNVVLSSQLFVVRRPPAYGQIVPMG